MQSGVNSREICSNFVGCSSVVLHAYMQPTLSLRYYRGTCGRSRLPASCKVSMVPSHSRYVAVETDLGSYCSSTSSSSRHGLWPCSGKINERMLLLIPHVR